MVHDGKKEKKKEKRVGVYDKRPKEKYFMSPAAYDTHRL